MEENIRLQKLKPNDVSPLERSVFPPYLTNILFFNCFTRKDPHTINTQDIDIVTLCMIDTVRLRRSIQTMFFIRPFSVSLLIIVNTPFT